MRFLGWRAVRVRGRSMEPTVFDGDLAFGRGPSRLRAGQVVLVELPGVGLSIKRLLEPNVHGQFPLRGDGPLSAPTIDMPPVSKSDVRAVLHFVWRAGRLHKIKARH